MVEGCPGHVHRPARGVEHLQRAVGREFADGRERAAGGGGGLVQRGVTRGRRRDQQFVVVAAGQAALQAQRARLARHTGRLRATLADLGYPIAQGSEQIIALEAGTEIATLALRDELEARGVFGAVFISPATSRNRALVRMTLNAGLTEAEVSRVEAVAAEVAPRVRPWEWAAARRQRGEMA